MAHVSIRLSENEKQIIENYAKWLDTSVSDMIKNVLFEKIEDDYDLKLIAAYEAEPEHKTYSHEEIGKMLGLS